MKTKNRTFLFLGSILLGIIGFLPSLLTVVGVDSKSKLNPKYYESKDEPLFIKKEKHWDISMFFFFYLLPVQTTPVTLPDHVEPPYFP